MKNFFRRTLSALVLSSVLLSSLAAPALARETNVLTSGAQEVDFKSLKPGNPDTAAFDAAADKLEAAIEKEENGKTVAELLTVLFESYKRIQTDSSVFTYHYSCEPARYADDYVAWNKAVQKVDNRFMGLVARLSTSQYREEAVGVLGADTVELSEGQEEDTLEEQALLTRQAEIVNEYWQFAGKTYTAAHEGSVYHTLDEAYAAINDGTLDIDAGYSVLLDLSKQSNADRGPLFVELIKVLNEYAQLNGFDNYGEYAYVIYSRDYTMEDAAAFHDLVRKYFVPLFQETITLTSAAPVITAEAEACEKRFKGLDQAAVVEMIQPYMDDVSGELADLFDYMLDSGLLDMEFSDTKTEGAYTSYLPSYQSAYVYSKPTGGSLDARTLVHEFGHFAAFCVDEEPYAGQSLDILEVNSQGLELLYLAYADEMLGDEAAYYRAAALSGMLDSVISGCYVDEFLQAAFTTPDLTLDKLNRLYHDILVSYGRKPVGDTYSYGWTDIRHNFQTPFYYISYATSAMASLELLDRSMTNYTDACDVYLALMEQGCKAKYGFRGALARVGLDDIFEEETVASLASAMEDYFYGEICGVDFPDLAGTWAEDGARFCGAMGIVTGGSGGSFSDGALTRAQAATILWPSAGASEPTDLTRLQDVPEHAWYAKAANRCAEKGVLVGAEETTFSPDAPVSRQEFLLALYRVYGSPETSAELSFSDQGEISPDALGGRKRPYNGQAGQQAGAQ